MKLARALTKGEFDNCFILTFNADLPFFESVIFGPLYDNGCRNLVIMMDLEHYAHELRESISLLRYVGQRYLCVPATGIAGVRFHPKLIVQTAENQGRIYVGSSNLSQPGLTRNWEAVTCVEYSEEAPDPIAREAFRSVLRYLQRLSESPGLPELLRRRANRLIASTPWVNLNDEKPEGALGLAILDNLDLAIWDQVAAGVPPSVSEVRIVSPYFDPVCRAFQRLIEDIRPQSIVLYIQPGHHNLDSERLRAVVDSYPGQFEVRALDLGNRRLHAKAIHIQTEQGVWLLTGSANFSVAGLLNPARYGNAELGVLRYEKDCGYFEPWWDEIHQRSDPMGIDWDTPLAGDEPPDELPTEQPEILVSSATLDSLGRLRLCCGDALPGVIHRLSLDFAASTTHRWTPVDWNLAGEVISMSLPDEWRRRLEQPWLVSLHLETSEECLSSLPVLVHHTGQLYRFSRPPRRGGYVPVPEGFKVDDHSQLLELMHLFQRLFVAKTSEINHRTHRIGGPSRHRGRDEVDLPEDDYDPEAHVADERVRYPDGSAFYRRYHDRVAFRDLMRVALRASYQAPKELRLSVDRPPEREPDDGLPGNGGRQIVREPEPTPTQNEEIQQADLMEDMKRGLQQLTRRLAASAEDREYPNSMPPSYLCEFFCGIVQFTGVIQDVGLLESKHYAQLSIDLLVAFYGLPSKPGIWPQLKRLHSSDTLEEIETHTGIHVRSWVLLYQIWRLLDVVDLGAQQETYRWQSADVARRLIKAIGDANQRRELSAPLEEQAERLWPDDPGRPALADFEAILSDSAQYYHIDLIKAELRQLGAASVEVRRWEGRYPDLHVTVPFRDLGSSAFLVAFQRFAMIHQDQPKIRAQFMQPSVASERQGRSVIFLYDRMDQTLVYAVRNEKPPHDTYEADLDLSRLGVRDLMSFGTLTEMLKWPYQKDYLVATSGDE